MQLLFAECYRIALFCIWGLYYDLCYSYDSKKIDVHLTPHAKHMKPLRGNALWH